MCYGKTQRTTVVVSLRGILTSIVKTGIALDEGGMNVRVAP